VYGPHPAAASENAGESVPRARPAISFTI